MIADDDGLRRLLRSLCPTVRNTLRRVLIRDQDDRDAIASQLMRYRDENGQGWADQLRHGHGPDTGNDVPPGRLSVERPAVEPLPLSVR